MKPKRGTPELRAQLAAYIRRVRRARMIPAPREATRDGVRQYLAGYLYGVRLFAWEMGAGNLMNFAATRQGCEQRSAERQMRLRSAERQMVTP